MTVDYEGVNSAGRLSVTWRFDEHGIWTEPIVYEAPAGQDVVSVHYFSDVKDGNPVPSLHASFLVVPGISEAATVSPIVRDNVTLKRKRLAGKGQFRAGAFAAVGLAGALLLRLQRGRCQAEDGTALPQADRLPLLAAWQICPAATCIFSSTPARAARG